MISYPESYITVVKIPKTKMKKLDIAAATEPLELFNKAYLRLGKPTFMLNGGWYNTKTGETASNFVDEGVVKGKGASDFGLIKKSTGISFGNINSGQIDFIGGVPALIKNSIINIDGNYGDGYNNARHPRSATGENEEYFFLVAVDGRQEDCPGMTLKELAEFMLSLGCTNAINLDGGGSTRLEHNGKAINKPTENRPSDSFICVWVDEEVKEVLEDVLLIIDPGHGGSDSGAAAFGYKEKDINLDISLELKLLARDYFPNIIMTRETDKYIDLSKRGQWVADAADKFLKVRPNGKVICFCEHNNAYNGQARGCEAIHSIYAKPDLAKCITKKITELGIPLRRVFFRESTNTKGADYYAMHRRTGKAQTVIIESFFVDNAQDIQFLKQPDFISKLAKKHLEGLLDYLGVSYTVPVPELKPEPKLEPQKPHWAQKDFEELQQLLGLEDHTSKLDLPATEGLVFNLINRMRKVNGD